MKNNDDEGYIPKVHTNLRNVENHLKNSKIA